MNKKEIRSAINKAAYAFAESMGYEIHDDEGDGTVLFAPHDYTSADDTITWHRSYHNTCVLNWASDNVRSNAEMIDAHMKPIIEHYNNQYQPKRATAQFGSYIHGIKLNDMIMKLLVVLAGVIGVLAVAAILAFGIVILMTIVDDKLN